jgi:hypothetical protein
MEREAGAWGCNWATLSLGDINTETYSSSLGVGRKADDLAAAAAKSKQVKTGCSLAETSKEGCGSKKGCFAIEGDDLFI